MIRRAALQDAVSDSYYRDDLAVWAEFRSIASCSRQKDVDTSPTRVAKANQPASQSASPASLDEIDLTQCQLRRGRSRSDARGGVNSQRETAESCCAVDSRHLPFRFSKRADKWRFFLVSQPSGYNRKAAGLSSSARLLSPGPLLRRTDQLVHVYNRQLV